jgi:EmrB/QacA subfamily drug resistance transporter
MDEEARSSYEHLSGKALGCVFAALMMAMFVGSLDQTITSTALASIVGELNGVDQMVWVTTAYMLTSTIMMPIYGKLGDLFGRKHLFLFAMTVFAFGSTVTAAAPTMGMLIAGRAIQGLGGGGLILLSQSIVADIFPPKQRGKFMGIMGAAFGISTVIGPLLGGWITDTFSWRWCFWINLPLSIIAIVMAAVFLPSYGKSGRTMADVDVKGIITLSVATSSLVLALSLGGNTLAWSSPIIIGLFIVAVVMAAAFVIVERHVKEPLMPLHLFKNRNFVLCTITGMVLMLGMMGITTYMPTYLQIVNGLSASAAGCLLIPMMLCLMVSSTASGYLVAKMDRVKLLPMVSCIICAVALCILSTITVDTSLVYLCLILALMGFGIGLGQQIVVLIVQNEFSSSIVGTATAGNNFFREIGGTLGSSVVGSMFTANLTSALTTNLAEYGGVAVLGFDVNSISPSLVRGLSDTLQQAVQLSYNEALTPVFLVLVPLFVVSVVLMAFCKNKPLSETQN